MKVISFDEISSTNLYLKDNYETLDNLTFVKANHQTQGRGRLGRTWEDSNDLLFSVLVKENINNPTSYSFLIASSILKVFLNKGLNAKIKWPNDILINNKKVVGILLEGISKNNLECVIIGVGINTNTTKFSSELFFKANSLKLIMKNDIDNDQLFKEIMDEFQKDYNDFINEKSNYLDIINDNSYLMGKEISFIFNNEKMSGLASSITDEGKLKVYSQNKVIELCSGEVTLTHMYK